MQLEIREIKRVQWLRAAFNLPESRKDIRCFNVLYIFSRVSFDLSDISISSYEVFTSVRSLETAIH